MGYIRTIAECPKCALAEFKEYFEYSPGHGRLTKIYKIFKIGYVQTNAYHSLSKTTTVAQIPRWIEFEGGPLHFTSLRKAKAQYLLLSI